MSKAELIELVDIWGHCSALVKVTMSLFALFISIVLQFVLGPVSLALTYFPSFCTSGRAMNYMLVTPVGMIMLR